MSLRWLLLAAALCAAAAALAARAELSAEVPASKWKVLRLVGLKQNASLTVRVETTGPIRIILARQDEAERFPKGVRAAFSGTAERRLSFRVRVPVAGTYYVILDNRKGEEARDVRVLIDTTAPAPAQPRPEPRRPGQSAETAV